MITVTTFSSTYHSTTSTFTIMDTWNRHRDGLPNIALAILTLVSALILVACGSSQEKHLVQPEEKWEKAHKISIVNASTKVINTIQYKPCGSLDNQYHYLTGNLKPQETLTMNIYTHCVDLRATNAFKKKLVDVKNVDLKAIRTWTIK